MNADQIIARAKRMGRINKEGLVLCDNCDTPADLEASMACGWAGCAPCIYGEADSLDEANFIHVEAA
ncbi:MAG: hypothetical protein M3O20_02015 [Acidobacteriota bacterium]|nr:hypothetical protein [Acidobacteriota bacterium]